MRILYVIDSLRTGGAETLLCSLARELHVRRGATIEIITLVPHVPEAFRLEDSGVQVRTLGLRRELDLWRGRARLIAAIDSFRPDVVHTHLFPADIITALALRGAQHRVTTRIFSEHSEWNRRRQYPWFRSLDRWTYGHFDRVVCVSDKVRQALERWIPAVGASALTLPNAVPIPDQPWRPDGTFATELLFVGRLVEAKGLDVLLRALHLLGAEGAHPSLTVVGDGPLRTQWEGLAAELGLCQQVRFLGRRQDVGELMRGARAFVLSSRWEGMPMVLLEAMAMGLPLVATAVSGVAELLESDRSGVVVPPESPASLAEGIRRLLTDPGEAAEMGKAARARAVARHSIAAYADAMLDVYRSAGAGLAGAGRHNA